MCPKAPTNIMTVLANILGTVAGTSGMLSGKWLCAFCMSQTGPKEPRGKSCPHKWGLPFLCSGLWSEVPGYRLLFPICTDRSTVHLQVGWHRIQPGPWSSLQGERNSEVLWGADGKTTQLKIGSFGDQGSLGYQSMQHYGMGKRTRYGQWVERRIRVCIITIWSLGWQSLSTWHVLGSPGKVKLQVKNCLHQLGL